MPMTPDPTDSALPEPVIIVGGGPAGLATALCLARAGVPSRIIDRRADPSSHPRAHVVNTRTMELFRAWGIDDRVRAAGYPFDRRPDAGMGPLLGADVASSLAGPLTREAISPVRGTSCAQDLVEHALLDAVATTGRVRVDWGVSCAGVRQDDHAVALDTHGPSGDITLHATWCVAADGANSTVRRGLGVGMMGDAGLGHRLNIQFRARLEPMGDVPPLIALSADPASPGAFVSMDGAERFCFHVPFDPETEQVADYDVERCAGLVRAAAGVGDDVAVDVVSISPWTMTALVAEQIRLGRIFLVGDAAHAFPPTGGFGMNSGIQDAHNLAWKLAGVISGWAPAAILQSYEAERLPVACFNTAQSLRNAGRGSTSDNPSAAVAAIERLATTTVRSMIASTEDPVERMAVAAREHFVAIGQDLGFAYDGSPIVVPDGTVRQDSEVSRYVPTARPGSRAPHVALPEDGRTGSLLDHFGEAFVLLTSSPNSAWTGAAERVASAVGIPLRTVALHSFGPSALRQAHATYGIDDSGAVLIRPDGHVAFRTTSAGGDLVARLRGALEVAVGAAPPPPASGER